MIKSALKVTVGTMLAAGVVAPTFASALHSMSISGSTTYTEASNNGLSFGDINTVPVAGQEGGRRALFVEPEHQHDWAMDLTFRSGTDTRLFVSYDHFHDNKSRDASGVRNIGIAPAFGVTSNGYADVSHRAHELRFGGRHMLHFGPSFDLDLNGFFEYAKVERKTFERIQSNGVINIRNTEDEVRGYGPGFGARARAVPLHDNPCWGIFGGLNASLLYANHEFNQNFSLGTDFPAVMQYQFEPEDSKSIVGKIDASFGIDYNRMIKSDMTSIILNVAVGMRYMNMFNALTSGNTAWNDRDVIGLDDSSAWAVNTGKTFDFGRMGPFLQVRLGGHNS